MDKTSILVVDDDPDILKILKVNFELHGYEVFTAENWQQAEEFLNKISILILDVILPQKNGFEILKEIRKTNPELPVILLTAKDKISDRILGLELGADDYVVKPFETLELIARVRACLRRSKHCSGQFLSGEIFIDFKQRIVKKGQKEIYLTPKEYALLCYLVSRRSEVVSKREIKNYLYSGQRIYSWSRVIDVHVMHLRKKLEDDPSNPKYIITVTGVGYKFI